MSCVNVPCCKISFLGCKICLSVASCWSTQAMKCHPGITYFFPELWNPVGMAQAIHSMLHWRLNSIPAKAFLGDTSPKISQTGSKLLLLDQKSSPSSASALMYRYLIWAAEQYSTPLLKSWERNDYHYFKPNIRYVCGQTSHMSLCGQSKPLRLSIFSCL